MTKISIEEKFEKAMQEEFKKMFIEQTPEDYVRGEFENKKRSLIQTFLGIEWSWDSYRFKHDSIVKKELDNLKIVVKDVLSKYSIDDIEFTPAEVKSLKKSYKEAYMNALEHIVRDAATENAEKKFNETMKKLGLDEFLYEE